LRDLSDAQDWLAERADIINWCQRNGVSCNPRQTGRVVFAPSQPQPY
jgi:hypothetical protein